MTTLHQEKYVVNLKYQDKKKDCKIWKKIRNKIKEMHWKSISYLTGNYDIVVI